MNVPLEKIEAFWNAVRVNCGRVSDAAEWREIVFGTLPATPVFGADDAAFVSAAIDHVPPEPWDGGTWKTWTDAVKAATGRKGRALFMPLRLALTGLDHGPELAALLPLIGRERALLRRPQAG